MQKLFTGIILAPLLVIAACATRASKVFTVDVDPISMQYTPGQIREFLRERGFSRVKFRVYTSGIIVYERRTLEVDEQRFRLESAEEIEVIVLLEKIRRTFGDSGPRLVVRFNEDGRSSLSELAQTEYEVLLKQVVERVGPDRVKEQSW